jgi:MTH538 TIR-like domain (DUF1863)
MKKTVFISYHFKDATYKGEIKKWLTEAGAEVISTDETDLRPAGENAVSRKIKEQISGSDLVLILVGNDTHNRPWVDYEVGVARSKQIPTYWVRLANRGGGPPKEVGGLHPIEYSRSAIVRVMRSS